MIKIDKETALKAKTKVDSFDDSSLNNYLKKLFAFQPSLGLYVEDIEEVFEDETDYFEKYQYYIAILNMAYKYSVDFIPEIKSDLIEKWEEFNLDFLNDIAEKDEEEQDELSLQLINNHNQAELLSFIHEDLFEADEDEYDDKMIEYDSQIFWLLKTIVDIYDDNIFSNEN